MNFPDEMLFLNPAPRLPACSVNTAYYQLGRQSTGTRETAGEDSYVVGAASYGKCGMGQKNGFGLNHYEVRGLTVLFSPAVVPFLSTRRR